MLSKRISYLSSSDVRWPEESFDVFERAAVLGFGDLHFKLDARTGIKAIIAIHSTHRGPALGGTRCLSYPSAELAIRDAMHLAQAMSYKSAFFRLPYGGGKGVLIRPSEFEDRGAYFESYGSFIEQLGGRFITSVDSGTDVEDMDNIARRTNHVVSTSGRQGDPSPYTAFGVCRAIEAAVKVKYHRGNLDGVHVAIQGVGNVGYLLARELSQRGAKLSVCDINSVAAQRCAEEFGASVVGDDELLSLDSDVVAPCALGSVIGDETVGKFRVGVICGAANNQLLDPRYGDILHRRGIVYVPDYVANGGGLMHAAPGDKSDLEERISAIYGHLIDILEQSERTDEPPHRIADRIAESALTES